MRRWLQTLVVVSMIAGCTVADTDMRCVQLEYGTPDVISDESGDQIRRYVPPHRPKHKWPEDAPRTFYYLDRNLFVEFVRGTTTREGSIPPETRDQLIRLVERNRSGESQR